MTSHVSYSPFVQGDVDEIWIYIAERNPDAAERVAFEIASTFRMIGSNPLVGTLRGELMIGLRQFPYKNYNIFYFPAENGVEIYRILHSSRDVVQIFDDSIDESR